MKQKRKVKSLISSNEKSNVGLTALLCLLGGILVFGAVALFTSSVGVEAAVEGEMEYDNGIEDNVEVLLNFKMAGRNSLNNAVNEMEFTGGTFYMKGNAGIAVDYISDTSIHGDGINYLGGEGVGVSTNIASNNITIIGGQNAKVFQNNNNATSLGGIGNTVNNGSNKVAPVMLGGNGNEISANQEGSAIVGGSSNKITGGGEYDFILGGEGSQINGKNVIVGGKGVNVDGKSDLFAFSDDRGLTPEGGKAFYLFVKNGLGLNKAAVNSGVDSNGAVSFGAIDINVSCTSADVGVQGTWNGCLVGCTQASKNDHNKWEMMDHGDDCERQCKDNSTHCKVLPIEPTPPDDYTSECTVGGVDTSNSTQCAANRLSVYENVMFETYLIDSSAECPEGIENKCVFRCNKDYHLTGNIAGGAAGTKKCYADCILPWNGEKIKHNETVVAYNAKTVACSNTDWVFPVATAIVNAPNTSEYPDTRTLNGMLKTTEAAGKSYESCTNYTHKKTLVCYNGELYIANTNGTKTNTKALGNTGAWYGYDVCETKDYKCPTGIYNLTQAYITSNAGAKDTVNWNNTDRFTSVGTRGQYKLCQDWTPSVGNSECKVGLNGNNGTVANNYHYQLVKCNDHYSTGTDNNQYECKKSCQMKDKDGNWTYKDKDGNEYKHNRVITGYTLSSEDCTKQGNGTCHAATIICVDGTWIMGSNKNGTQKNTQYLYNDCKLNPYVCAGNYNLSQEYPNGTYISCDPYSAKNNNKFQCTKDNTQYDLVGCNTNYHTENNRICVSDYDEVNCNTYGVRKPANNSHYNIVKVGIEWNGRNYNSGTPSFYSEGTWSDPVDCTWDCDPLYHESGNSCEYNYEDRSCGTLPNGAQWVNGANGWQHREWVGGGWTSRSPGCDWDCGDLCFNGVECVNDPNQCVDKKYCSCANAPEYSSCTPYAVMTEGVDCSYECVNGTMNADGSCPPPPKQYCSCANAPEYSSCTPYAVTTEGVDCSYECVNGTMNADGSCPPPSKQSCTGCPGKSSVAHGGKCTSYSTNSSCSCSDEKRVSTCNDGDWDGGDPLTYGSCSAPASCGGGFSCTGDEPGNNTRKGSTSPSGGNKAWSSGFKSNPTATLGACEWSCESGYVRVGNTMDCEKQSNKSCGTTGATHGDCSFSIPALDDGQNTTVSTTTDGYNGSITATCNNGTITLKNGSCVKHACGIMAKNTCSAGGSVQNEDSSDLEMYEWDCKRGAEVKHCTYCKSVSKCEDIGLSSSPTGTCYDRISPKCVPSQACYKNRACTCEDEGGYDSEEECNAAVGHTGIGTACYTEDGTCFYPSKINGECDIENRDCIAGDYEYIGAGYNIVRWKCKGIGNGSTAECEYFANCASRGLGYNGCSLNDAGFKDGKCVYEIDYGYGYPCWATECCQGYSHSVYVGGKQYTIWENYVGNG